MIDAVVSVGLPAATMLLLLLAVGSASAQLNDTTLPINMRQVFARGQCVAPFTECVGLATVNVPVPRHGEVLVQMMGSSVNPSDRDTVEGGGCLHGCGHDLSGVVVACPGCKRIKVGDHVWVSLASTR